MNSPRSKPGSCGHPFLNAGIVALVLLLSGVIPAAHAASENGAYYWLWAGLTEQDLPADTDAVVYLYQGNIAERAGQPEYAHKGLSPYPIHRAHIQLVYRLETHAADTHLVAAIYRQAVEEWAQHGIKIEGLQLDCDWPTRRLAAYGDYLQQLRAQLPAGHGLSVTGLGDWIEHGDPAALRRVAKAADDIVFQLYAGRHASRFAADYVTKLSRADFPFRVGLLPGQGKDSIVSLDANPYYRGAVTFLQKKNTP